jgi:hypothetical protein
MLNNNLVLKFCFHLSLKTDLKITVVVIKRFLLSLGRVCLIASQLWLAKKKLQSEAVNLFDPLLINL